MTPSQLKHAEALAADLDPDDFLQPKAAVIVRQLLAERADLLAALHGGPDAQADAMPSNLAYFAELIERGELVDNWKDIAVDSLRKYAAMVRAVVAKASPTLSEAPSDLTHSRN